MLTTFNFANRQFKISVLSHQEVKSPWSPEMGNVIKYLVEVSSGGQSVSFDFFGSIADCDSKRRDAYNRLNAFLSGENTGIHFVDSGDTANVRKGRMRDKINEIARNVSGNADSYFGTADAFKRIGEAIRDAKSAGLALYNTGRLMPYEQVKDLCKRLYNGDSLSSIIARPKIRYIDTEEALLWAFRCWLSDASVGDYTIDEFQDEFDYKKPSELLKVYRGCQNAEKQARTLGLNAGDVCDAIEALTEMGIE